MRQHLSYRFSSLLLVLVASAAGLSACGETSVESHLRIVQVQFSDTVVLPGETITMSALTDGDEDIAWLWEAEAGDLSSPDSAETQWTAPGAEQLVAISVTATSESDLVAVYSTDLVVGPGTDHDGDGFSLRAGDCDDTNPAIYPGSPDVQDGLDNDCDGLVDEGSPEADDDADGFSDFEGDCNDSDPGIYPGADEIVNGVDDDCDTVVDENTDAHDDDEDGYSEQEGDCNDITSAVSPVAPEILDGIDNDCDGIIDEGTAASDDDADGFSELSGDCNDDPDAGGDAAFPGRAEEADGVDNDCDGLVDEDFFADEDGDGWSVLAGDCDDTDFYTYAGAPEFADGVDNDCNGQVDDSMDTTDDDGDGLSEADGDCDDTLASVSPLADEVEDVGLELDNDCDGYFYVNPPLAVASFLSGSRCTNGVDDDGDGWIDDRDPDCVTGFPESGIGLTACNDGVDNDFDSFIDADDINCASGLNNSESSGSADDCLNGQDDDADGWVDAADPDCIAVPFNESVAGFVECNDGVDNDGDQVVDAEDPECDNGFDGSESSAAAPHCEDGVDNDQDGWVDALDIDCFVSPFRELGDGPYDCNDGVDNDGDGAVDAEDAGCEGSADGDEGTDTCSTVVLQGGESWDPDQDDLSYYWYFSQQPINSTLSTDDIVDGDGAVASFIPDVPGYWVVGLLVSDGRFNSEPEFVFVQVAQGACP